MNNCQLDNLPVELIYHLLSYFSSHEIFYTFMNVTSYLNAALVSYLNYEVNFKSISRTNFDLICQHIIPDQVIALTLSDDENTPGLVELFLSRFRISQFTRLQSLKLIEIGPDFWENIITKLVELKNLRSFSFFPSNRDDSWICNLPANDVTQLDKSLFDSYAPVLPQLYQLRLCHGDFLKSIQFPHLQHLILERSSVDIIKHICSVAPQLKSLDTSFSDYELLAESICPLTQLNRLVLKIHGPNVSMNDMERMMSNLTGLKHLELNANCDNDVVNGQRWKIKVKYLITFKFVFNLTVQLESKDLDSFRTSFWVEEKRWFVAYTHKRLFSVPYFNGTETGQNFRLPLYSSAPDNEIFYQSIDKLYMLEIPDNTNHHFTHVQTLSLGSCILPSIIKKTVDLNQVQHLIVRTSMENFSIKLLINEMPNLREISIRYDVKSFFKQVRYDTIEKIQTLQISNPFMDSDDYNIEQLCSVFSNIKHLQVDHTCSTIQIFDFLDRFKHLSTASFHYASWSDEEEEDMQKGHLKIQSVLDRIRRLQRLNYTYRFDCSSVHFWIR